MKKISFRVLFGLLVSISVTQAQWVQTSGPNETTITALAVKGSNLFAGTYDDGVYRSTNMGTNWSQINIGLSSNRIITSFAIIGDNVFVGTDGDGIFLSTNNGSNWNAVNNGLNGFYIRQLVVDETKLFAVTDGGTFISTDNGTSWTKIITPGHNNSSIAIKGANIFISDSMDGVFVSNDNGLNWNLIINGLVPYSSQLYNFWNVISITVCGNSIFLSLYSQDYGAGFYRTTNDGELWEWKGHGISYIDYSSPKFIISGNNIFLANYEKVYLSIDNGENWFLVNDGLPDEAVNTLVISDAYIYAGVSKNGVWRRPLSEIITGVEEKSDLLPAYFLLEQNFPNPFNPTTTIKYSIPQQAVVSLSISDLLGREVAVLVNEDKPAGRYEIIFNASNLSSGIYFYRIIAGEFIQTKKLLLMK